MCVYARMYGTKMHIDAHTKSYECMCRKIRYKCMRVCMNEQYACMGCNLCIYVGMWIDEHMYAFKDR